MSFLSAEFSMRRPARAATACALALFAIVPLALTAQTILPVADSCLVIPTLEYRPDGSVVLPTLIGRVLDSDKRSPLVGARLQLVGTQFTASTDSTGVYHLEFDPRSFEGCRAQFILVSAPGHKQTVVKLKNSAHVGPSADVILRSIR